MKKQKIYAWMTILALSVSMFAGCGSTEKNTESGSETETVSAVSETVSESASEPKTEATESTSTQKPKPATDKLKAIPSKYSGKCKQAGTVVTVTYETDAYGAKMTKEANVYLPYEYDENKKYDIIYCMHGGGGNIKEYFSPQATFSMTRLLFDHMIMNGEMDPFIAVAPTYYGGQGGDAQLVETFCKDELQNDLIPAIEGMFSTYAESTDPEDLKAAREHRAYCGFSMGGLSTWYTFLFAGDYFYYYLPFSGDCWVNGSQNAVGGAKLLEQNFQDKGYKEDDFFIYAVTGSDDIAYSPMKAQMEAMKTQSPSYHFITPENPKGNICFRVQPGASHSTACLPQYFYNALPTFWKGEPVYP